MPEPKDLLIPESRRSRLPEPYPFDDMLIQQYQLFTELLTDDIYNRLRERCIKEDIPWISPDYYFPIFNLGMARIINTTPDFTVEQCLAAENPDDLRVAPSIASNLMKEYENKLVALRKIKERKATAPELVEVKEGDLRQAEEAYRKFMGSAGITTFSGMIDVPAQRAYLRQFVARARQEVLPKIQAASKPVIEAGTQVLDIAFDMMGIQKEQTRQLPTINQLPPPEGLR